MLQISANYIANIYNMQSLIQKKSKDRATLKGKFKKPVDPKILFHSYFFNDVLTSAKTFSLQTQKLTSVLLTLLTVCIIQSKINC